MGIKQLSASKSDLYRLPRSAIEIVPGWNARDFTTFENKAHVAALAASIKVHGVKTPIFGRMDGEVFKATDGESRLRAIDLIIKQGGEPPLIPVINEDRGTTDEDRLITQIVGNSGKPFEALEKAEVFFRLIGFGNTEKQIAEKVGCSRQHVIDMLSLRSADTSVKDAISTGTVSPTLALQTIKGEGGDQKKAAAKIKEGVTKAKAAGKKKATAKHVAPTKPKAKPVKPSKTDAATTTFPAGPAALPHAAATIKPSAGTSVPPVDQPESTGIDYQGRFNVLKGILDKYDPAVLPGVSVEVVFSAEDWSKLKAFTA